MESCGKAGISVALIESVMRLSETITIYLAAGASFGVSRYLYAASRAKSRRRAAAEGVAATLLWPLMAAAILTKRLRLVEDGSNGTEEPDARVNARIEEARRAFVGAVNEMLEAVRTLLPAKREMIEHTLYALREGADQYVGLARIRAGADEDAAPAAFEMELARISGRLGDDLLVAGRCVHRRNVWRIKAHYARERSRLLQKLEELRAVEENALSSKPDDACRAERRKLTEARLEIYLRATDLFSLLEDKGAARSAAQLTNADCSYLRHLKETNGEALTTPAPGEERCTEPAPQLLYKDPLRVTTFTQG